MKTGRAVVFGCVLAGLGVHFALAAGALGVLPGIVRTILAFAVLVLLPGAALLRLVDARPPGGSWLAPGWMLPLGVGWNALLVLCAVALKLPFTALASGALVTTSVLWALAIRRPRADTADAEGVAGLPLMVVLLAAVLVAWHAGVIGTYITYYSDSPDHIGTIRRMIESHEAFPVDAFFRNAGESGADPRKGLWHPQVALIALLAGVDPYDAWRNLSACLSPLFVLNAAAFGFLLAGRAGAAVAAVAFTLTYGGSLAAAPIRETVYSTKLADQLALATLTAVLADLRHRTVWSRLTAVGIGWAAVATHLFASIQFAVVFLALGVAMLLRDRSWSERVRRLTVTVVTVALPCIPFLLFRAMHSYGPQNVIHTEPQGLLFLMGDHRITSIGVLWEWTGILWVLFPVSWWFLWRFGRDNEAALTLLSTSLAVALIIFNPAAVAVLEPRIGYLLMRFVWMLPVFGLLTWLVVSLSMAVREAGSIRRVYAAGGLLIVTIIALPAVRDSVAAVASPESILERNRQDSPLRWRDALDWMRLELPRGSVVLADPATSYSIPMMTGHYVATLVDQHSSPNDPHALTRILDVRDALDPFGDWDRMRDVVQRYDVTHIALNGRFVSPPHFDYWAPSQEWYWEGRRRLDAHPDAFVPRFDRSDFVVYEVRRSALDSLEENGQPRPFVLQTPAAARDPVRIGESLPLIDAFRLNRDAAAAGDSATMVIDWRVREPLPAGSYSIYVRFDRPLPDGISFPGWISKPARKVLERVRGERYRFRIDRLPTGGQYGVDLWRPSEVVRDSFAFRVPADAAPGEYSVRVQMLREPHYPNYRLSDYFFDDDYYAGPIVGRFEVLSSGTRDRGDG